MVFLFHPLGTEGFEYDHALVEESDDDMVRMTGNFLFKLIWNPLPSPNVSWWPWYNHGALYECQPKWTFVYDWDIDGYVQYDGCSSKC